MNYKILFSQCVYLEKISTVIHFESSHDFEIATLENVELLFLDLVDENKLLLEKNISLFSEENISSIVEEIVSKRLLCLDSFRVLIVIFELSRIDSSFICENTVRLGFKMLENYESRFKCIDEIVGISERVMDLIYGNKEVFTIEFASKVCHLIPKENDSYFEYYEHIFKAMGILFGSNNESAKRIIEDLSSSNNEAIAKEAERLLDLYLFMKENKGNLPQWVSWTGTQK
jgi:hypothetical protein